MAGFQLGSSIGLVLSPILMSKGGVFGPFVIFGLSGFLWVLVWLSATSSIPERSPQISKSELDYILTQRKQSPQSKLGESSKAKVIPPFKRLLSKLPTWSLMVANAMHSWGFFIILSWMPIYFKTVYYVDLKQAAWFSAVPWSVMAIVGYLGGALSDMLIQHGYSVTLTRKIMQSIGFIGPGISLIGLATAKSPTLATAWLTFAVGLKSFSHSGFLVNIQEIAPKYTGILHGLANTAGTFAAILGTIGAGFFVELFGSFKGFLWLTSVLYFLAALFWNLFSTGEQVNFDEGKQTQQKKSFLHHLRAAAKKIALIFTAFGSKSKKDAPQDYQDYGIKHSSQTEPNSSGYSSGSKNRSSPFRQSSVDSNYQSNSGEVYGSLNFTLEDIKTATKNFSQGNVIGEGGFGTVYKGKLRDGTLVAIKRARKDLYASRTAQEFKSEILAFSKMEHLNLVRFYGFLEHPNEKIIVVEYVGNGTLFQHLHGNRGDCLELAERLDIAIDVAHAITYLHSYNDPPIIHRDIKASNVLITEKLRAKVADFGLARLLPDDADVTHISTQIKGTVGYLDPEYMRTYQLTEKSDVYSFGILLVELVTGRHPLEPKKGVRERITARWAMSKLREGMPVLAMDPRLNRSPASIKAIEKVLRLALKCIGDVRPSRPSMKECVEALWAIRKEFKESAELIHSASHKSVDLLEKDARKTRRQALGIEEESYTFMSA